MSQTSIINAAPIQPPTPTPTVPECWVTLYPEGVSECYPASDHATPERAKERAVREANSCPGAVVLHYAPGTPTPSQDLIDLHDYIGCLTGGVKPDDSLRDRVAVVLARVAAGKAVRS